MDVWLEMWVDFVYWQWGGRWGCPSRFCIGYTRTQRMFGAAMKGGSELAWHSDLYDCITVTVTC